MRRAHCTDDDDFPLEKSARAGAAVAKYSTNKHTDEQSEEEVLINL